LQFFHVDLLNTADQCSQFLWLESVNNSARYDPVEASLEGGKLFGDVFVEDEVSIQQAVILTIVQAKFGGAAILHQFLNVEFAERFKLNVEVQFKFIDSLGFSEG
jgi:hypothetical protein